MHRSFEYLRRLALLAAALTIFAFASTAPVLAQEGAEHKGEFDLVLPDLGSVTFLGGSMATRC